MDFLSYMEVRLVGSTNNLIKERGETRNYLIRKFNSNPLIKQLSKLTPKPIRIDYPKIKSVLEDAPEKNKIIRDLKRFSQNFARKCYSKYDWNRLLEESFNETLMNKRILESGHHSVFEHIWLDFDITAPKIIAMVLNNQKQYATSEKSARYTIMEAIAVAQKIKYDWWMDKLIPVIDKVYPQCKGREEAIQKLAQENARYMTSVFTETTFGYTTNLRQINFIQGGIEKLGEGNSDLEKKLNPHLKEFGEKTSTLRIEGLDNQTDRSLDFFRDGPVKEYFGDVYATNAQRSGACFAQDERHRTTMIEIYGGVDLNAHDNLYIPDIVKYAGLEDKWLEDLREISQYDFTQAQLFDTSERGLIEDFRSKTFLRNCGHAQHETMKVTTSTAKKYEHFQEKYGPNALKPKCLQGVKCPSPCVWKGKKALERIV